MIINMYVCPILKSVKCIINNTYFKKLQWFIMGTDHLRLSNVQGLYFTSFLSTNVSLHSRQHFCKTITAILFAFVFLLCPFSTTFSVTDTDVPEWPLVTLPKHLRTASLTRLSTGWPVYWLNPYKQDFDWVSQFCQNDRNLNFWFLWYMCTGLRLHVYMQCLYKWHEK